MASRRKRAQQSAITAYCIADARFPIYDGTGASLTGGRWNSQGKSVIYAALSHAGALLERLVHAGIGELSKNQQIVVIIIPPRVRREQWSAIDLPKGWAEPDAIASRRFGDDWLQARRSAVLIVPSVIAKYENNVGLNTTHPDFRLIRSSKPEPVVWDSRLA